MSSWITFINEWSFDRLFQSRCFHSLSDESSFVKQKLMTFNIYIWTIQSYSIQSILRNVSFFFFFLRSFEVAIIYYLIKAKFNLHIVDDLKISILNILLNFIRISFMSDDFLSLVHDIIEIIVIYRFLRSEKCFKIKSYF